MLSNHTLSSLEISRDLVKSSLQKKGINPGLVNILNKDLSHVMGQINEAKHRHVVGYTDNGQRVYTAINPYGFSCGDKVLYIEGLPSGWDLASFDNKSGNEVEVVIDGGQNWTELITFN